MEFRSITDLEQLETLPDDAQILVIDNNTAKRISKANAKFGGGAMVVTFTYSTTGFSADKTVEEVTAAMASMPIIGNAITFDDDASVEVPLGACSMEYASEGNPTPAFGPFSYNQQQGKLVGVIGVNSSGQWEMRLE